MLGEWIKILRERTQSQSAAARAGNANQRVTEPPREVPMEEDSQESSCIAWKNIALEPEQLGCHSSPLCASVSPCKGQGPCSTFCKAFWRLSEHRQSSELCLPKKAICLRDPLWTVLSWCSEDVQFPSRATLPVFLSGTVALSDLLTCLLRNLYAGQEATVRIGHGTTDWFQIGKGVRPGCTLSSCLFNLHAEYIMQNAGLVESQAGIKTAGRNGDNLIHADNTTLAAECEKELKSLLMRVKEESEKAGVMLNIEKTKIMASGPNTSRQIDGEKVETVTFYFLGLQNHCRWWL